MARRIRRALLASPSEDPQQNLVYFWENQNFRAQYFGSAMKLPEARKLARSMARFMKVPAPRVNAARKGKKYYTAWQQGRSLTVNTDKAKWTPTLLAHEIAHWACDAKGHKGQAHGPVWMGVYLKLLHKFKIMPIQATLPLARAYGIKVRKCW